MYEKRWNFTFPQCLSIEEQNLFKDKFELLKNDSEFKVYISNVPNLYDDQEKFKYDLIKLHRNNKVELDTKGKLFAYLSFIDFNTTFGSKDKNINDLTI
jgi:hypothetical protein